MLPCTCVQQSILTNYRTRQMKALWGEREQSLELYTPVRWPANGWDQGVQCVARILIKN